MLLTVTTGYELSESEQVSAAAPLGSVSVHNQHAEQPSRKVPQNEKPITLIALSLLLQNPVRAADTAPSRRPLKADDFYNLQLVSDPQVSPDGKWVAYVVSGNDRDADESRSTIWMTSWDGSQQVQLTNAGHEISSPRWSRDGRYLSYLNTPAGTDKSQIMLFDRRGGEARALTSVTDDIQSYEWSPDSKRIVLVMEQGAPKAAASRRSNNSSLLNPMAAAPDKAASPPAAPATPRPAPEAKRHAAQAHRHRLHAFQTGQGRLPGHRSQPPPVSR